MYGTRPQKANHSESEPKIKTVNNNHSLEAQHIKHIKICTYYSLTIIILH